MPVVMLLLILMPLTMAGELCMLCQCLLLGRGRARRRLALLAGAVLLLLAACLGLLSMLGLWRDRVREWEGQTVVAEYSGIFRETGYRYVNWFVHGEQVYVWED